MKTHFKNKQIFNNHNYCVCLESKIITWNPTVEWLLVITITMIAILFQPTIIIRNILLA